MGIISALAGIGGGLIMVPFLYIIYSSSWYSLTAQTIVAHATSLGVACVAALIGIWRYSKSQAIVWKTAFIYGVPGTISSFITARIVSQADDAEWVRGAFGLFLVISAIDMARRAFTHRDFTEPHEAHRASPVLLMVIGFGGGIMTSMLGIGGGLIAVPALLYVARLPIRTVAPTSLVSVGLSTLSGMLSYATAPSPPPLSDLMLGWLDLRMAIPLALGAVCTVPLGVRLNRASRPATLYWVFSLIFVIVGIRLMAQGWFS